MRKLLAACIVGLAASCSPSSVNDGQTIPVDVYGKTPLSEFFESYSYIVLETSGTEDNLISNIKKIEIVGESIYILDDERKSIFMFDTNGRYTGKISRYGRGAGEYLSLEDFCVYDSRIYVLSRMNRAILTYSREGEHLATYGLDDWYNNLYILDERRMYLYSEKSNNKMFNFVLYDYVNDKYISEQDPFRENRSYMFSQTPFHKTASGMPLVAQQFDQTIYELDGNELSPLYHLQFNTKEKLPENYKELNFDELSKEFRYRSVVKRIELISQDKTGLYMVFSAFYDDAGIRRSIAKVDLSTNTAISKRLGDDVVAEFPFMSNPVSFHEKNLVTWYSPITINRLREEYSLNLPADLLVHDDDNPVLFLYKLKQ